MSDFSMRLNDRDSVFNGNEAILPAGGYSSVIKALSEGLDIRRGVVVRAVNYEGERVEVTCEDGSRLSS